MADDVLDFDDGVIHQNADYQRQGEQGDTIDGKTQQIDAAEGGQDGEGQGGGRNQGGAPVAQEEPDHQDGQQGAFIEQLHGAVVVIHHRGDKVERFVDADIGVLGPQLVELVAHTRHHIHFTGPLAAHYLEGDYRLAIQ